MKLFKKFNLDAGVIATDTETTGLNPWGDFDRWGFEPARPYVFTFCDVDGNTAYVRWRIDPKTRTVIPDPESRAEMREIMGDKSIAKIGHNLSYDIRMFEMSGIPVKGRFEDTLIMSHVCTGGKELQYGLKYLAKKYLGINDDDESDLHKAAVKGRRKGKKLGWYLANKDEHGRDPVKADYWMAPEELCKRYGVRDAERAMLFYLAWLPVLESNPNNREVYEREMGVFNVIRKMENRGVQVIPAEVKRLRKDYTAYMAKHQRIAEKHGGKGLNFKSPKQMTKVFYLERGLKPTEFKAVKKPFWSVESLKRMYRNKELTKAQYKKYYSIVASWGGNVNARLNGDDLVHLATKEKDPLAKSILEYRGARHMIDAFLTPYERFMVKDPCNPGGWVLHPNFRQVGTVTGRLSCGDPNLMQVASETTGRRRTEITLKPRECLGPRKGYVWYLPDYSQMEVWSFSFQAQIPEMMDALLSGRDFHGSIGEQVWGEKSDYEEKKSYYRKRAKLLMFCTIYGGGVGKVAYLTDSTHEEAEEFCAQYHKRLPGIRRYMRRMIQAAERDNKIVNPFGREYYMESKFAYKAVNYMTQGTCADIMKNGMIYVDKLLSTRWKGCHLLLTLHDELIIEVPLEYHSKQLMREIVHEMQRDSNRLGLPVPLPVSMKIATTVWNTAKDVPFVHNEWKERYLNESQA